MLPSRLNAAHFAPFRVLSSRRAVLQLQAICFWFGKPEISFTKLTEHEQITATRLSELTFPSFKSHMVRRLLPGRQPFCVAVLISHMHSNFRWLFFHSGHIIFWAGTLLTPHCKSRSHTSDRHYTFEIDRLVPWRAASIRRKRKQDSSSRSPQGSWPLILEGAWISITDSDGQSQQHSSLHHLMCFFFYWLEFLKFTNNMWQWCHTVSHKLMLKFDSGMLNPGEFGSQRSSAGQWTTLWFQWKNPYICLLINIKYRCWLIMLTHGRSKSN